MESTFVSIGDYPGYRGEGNPQVNLHDCGLQYVPTVYDITFPEKCFNNEYNSNIVFDYRAVTRVESPQTRMYGGTSVELGEVPWVVLFRDVKEWWLNWGEDKYMCSGVLITLEWVLTAAHCVDGRHVFLIFII